MDYNQFNLNPLRLQSLYENYGLPDPSGGGGGGYQDPFSSAPTFEQGTYSPEMVGDPLTPRPQAPPPPTVQQGRSPFNLMEAMSQYKPETAATDRFNQLIDQFPQQERPSLGRTIVSSAMGLGRGNVENSQKFLHEPYIRDVAAWKEQAGPAYNAANLERQSNINERTLTGNLLTAGVNQERYMADAENTRIKNEINQQKQLGYTFDASGPTIKRHKPDGTIEDTGIPTGKLSDWDKLQIQGDQQLRLQGSRNQGALDVQGSRNQGALDVQGSRNEGAYATQGLRNQGAMNVQGLENEGDIAVAGIRGPTGGASGDSPSETNRRRSNAMQFVMDNDNPTENLSRFIVPVPGGFQLRPPSGSTWNTSTTNKKEAEDFQRLQTILNTMTYPGGTPSTAPTPRVTVPPRTQPAPVPPSTGRGIGPNMSVIPGATPGLQTNVPSAPTNMTPVPVNPKATDIFRGQGGGPGVPPGEVVVRDTVTGQTFTVDPSKLVGPAAQRYQRVQ